MRTSAKARANRIGALWLADGDIWRRDTNGKRAAKVVSSSEFCLLASSSQLQASYRQPVSFPRRALRELTKLAREQPAASDADSDKQGTRKRKELQIKAREVCNELFKANSTQTQRSSNLKRALQAKEPQEVSSIKEACNLQAAQFATIFAAIY